MSEPVIHNPVRRRWLQFSMRSLLVAITLVAIPLGVIVRRAERQRRAVERIESLGGIVWYDSSTSGVMSNGIVVPLPRSTPLSWARQWLGKHYFDTAWHVQAVKMRESRVVTSIFVLPPVPVQTKFSLEPTQVIDAVGQLHSLRSLNLSYSRTTDADLMFLLQLTSLERLELDSTLVTDAGLAILRELRQLKSLSVQDSNVTAAGVTKLQRGMPNCLIQANAIELPYIDWGLNPLDIPAAK